jgi:hypothetical protein
MHRQADGQVEHRVSVHHVSFEHFGCGCHWYYVIKNKGKCLKCGEEIWLQEEKKMGLSENYN